MEMQSNKSRGRDRNTGGNMNGLTLTLDEFEGLPIKKQMRVLFENQQKTIRLIEGYKFYQKVNMWITGVLTTGMAGLWGVIMFK